MASYEEQVRQKLAAQYARKEKKRIANLATQAQGLQTAKQSAVTTQQQNNAATQQPQKTPYLDIASNYEAQARANLANQEQAMANQLAASKQGTNASYNSAAAGNYINYMKQQNALPEQLARQGINGGASESAMTRIGNNYAMYQGNTTAQRIAALAQLQSAYDTNLANMRNTAEENIMNNRMALQQSQTQYDDTLAQRAAEEARYREEVERAERQRTEDIAREDKLRQEGYDREDFLWNRNNAREDALLAYERQQAEQQNAQAEAWRQAEWQKAQIDQQVEQFAAGLLQYTDVKQLQKLRDQVIAVNPNWTSDPLLYGYVMAFNNRIGVIKASKK